MGFFIHDNVPLQKIPRPCSKKYYEYITFNGVFWEGDMFHVWTPTDLKKKSPYVLVLAWLIQSSVKILISKLQKWNYFFLYPTDTFQVIFFKFTSSGIYKGARYSNFTGSRRRYTRMCCKLKSCNLNPSYKCVQQTKFAFSIVQMLCYLGFNIWVNWPIYDRNFQKKH